MNASFFYWRCSVVEKGAVNGYKERTQKNRMSLLIEKICAKHKKPYPLYMGEIVFFGKRKKPLERLKGLFLLIKSLKFMNFTSRQSK
jgi:hypothetical protein